MDPPSGVVSKVVRAGMEPKSQTRILFTGPFDFDVRADRIQLSLMAQAFQIKLREVLREELGITDQEYAELEALGVTGSARMR